jgi:hypothetical protein
MRWRRQTESPLVIFRRDLDLGRADKRNSGSESVFNGPAAGNLSALLMDFRRFLFANRFKHRRRALAGDLTGGRHHLERDRYAAESHS